MSRGEFTVRVKEELAALRPATPAERRALLAALLRFAATLHIGGTLGPRYTLVLATGSGGVTRLAFWLLYAGYGVRPDVRVREAGPLAPRARYELVLADRVERVLADSGILDGAGRLSFGVAGGLVRSREAAACFARGAFLGRGSVSAPTREPHLEFGAPEERTATDLAALLDAHLDAIDGALAGTAYEGLGPTAGRLVGARDLLRRTVAIGGRPVSDVVPGV